MNQSNDKRIDEILGRLGQVAEDQEAEQSPLPRATINQSTTTKGWVDRVTDAVIEQQQAESTSLSSTLQHDTHRPRWAIFAPAAAALMLAVGFTLFQPASLPTIASYSLNVQGFDQQLRTHGSATTESVSAISQPKPITVGNRLVLTLRPDRRLTGTVHASLWRANDRRPVRLPLEAQIAPNGAVQFSAILGDQLTLPTGDETLWAVVSSGADEPAPQRISQVERATQTEHWYVVPIRLRVRSANSVH